MTEQQRLMDNQVPYQAPWVPAGQYRLVLAGPHFDAVRIAGKLAMDVADALVEITDYNPGPIIREVHGRAWMYFLVQPQIAQEWSWPFGVRVLDASRVSHVGIPALWGNTWPLCWRSVPTTDARLVEAERLYEVVCAKTGFTPIPVPTG